jgi:UDP-3-O-[3-hydroxymyristoyl] glucosamine N-acyltransferase
VPGVHPQAWIAESASVAEDVEVGAFAVIESGAHVGQGCSVGSHVYIGPDVRVGAGCILGVGAVLLPGTVLAASVRVEPGVVLGSTGFGFVLHQGEHMPIPQVSGVDVADGAVIGAGTCVDRGTLTPTSIGEHAEIGAQVQIAHNVTVGARSKVHHQAGIAGSSRVGADCELGLQSGMAGQASLGDGSVLAVRGGLVKKFPPGSDLWGFPARPKVEVLRAQAALNQLAKLHERPADDGERP